MDDIEDPGPSAVVARADALMQRRRQPAGPRPPEAEDIPVLTEVVSPGGDASSPAPPRQDSPAGAASEEAATLDPAVLDLLAAELSRRIEEHLAAEIPSLVEAALQTVVAQLAQELRSGVVHTTEAAIREFLAEPRKFVTPLRQR